MKNNRLLTIITVLVALMMACNISIGDGTSATPTPVVIVVTQTAAPETAVAPTEEATSTTAPLPTETAGIVATSTASTPVVTPLKDPVNCRFGPSMFFEQVGALNVGEYMPVIGKSADGGWWQVLAGEKKACWVGVAVTTVSGDLSGVQVVAAPDAFITDLKFQIKPNSANLGKNCTKIPTVPFTLKATISTNGPLTVQWHIESQQNGVEPTKTIKIAEFGPHDFTFTFAPETWKKGNYWVHIVVTKPIGMVADVTYNVSCQ